MSIQSEINRLKQVVSDAFTAIANKGGTVPSSKVSGNLASAINSIPAGVTVQRASGTVTGVSGSNKTVDCGFKPDAVFFTGTNSYSGDIVHAGVLFGESTSATTFFTGSSNSYIYSYFTVTQASNGFTVSGKRINTSLSTSNESNRSLNYIAIKFTE